MDEGPSESGAWGSYGTGYGTGYGTQAYQGYPNQSLVPQDGTPYQITYQDTRNGRNYNITYEKDVDGTRRPPATQPGVQLRRPAVPAQTRVLQPVPPTPRVAALPGAPRNRVVRQPTAMAYSNGRHARAQSRLSKVLGPTWW